MMIGLPSKRFLLSIVLLACFAFWLPGASAEAKSDFVSDPSFGGRGLVMGGVGPAGLSASRAPTAFAKDEQGRVIVGAASGPVWRVWRVLPSGDIDSSFGEQGEVVITRWGGYTASTTDLTSGVLRPDGRILLVGYVGSYAVGDIRKGDATMVMVQLMPDGSPDLSFGQDGSKSAAYLNGAARVALRPDGGFLVGAFRQITRTGRTDDGALYSYTADGRRDWNFGGGKSRGSVNILGAPHKPSYVFDVEVLRDGRILATGVSKNNLLLMRLHEDGSPDRSFGRSGRLTFLPGGKRETFVATSRDMELDKKGRIVLAGFVYPKDASKADYGLVMRFGKNGRVDRSFGNNGIVRLYATPRKGEERATRLYDLAIDPKGGIWVTGSAGRSARGERHAIVARYLPNGKKDARFFKNGLLNIKLGDGSTGSAVLRAGRKIYVSGRYYHGDQERFFLKRIKPRG